MKKPPTPGHIRHTHSISIAAQATQRLSRTQLRFNKLTHRIGKLEKNIGRETARLEKLFAVYVRDVQPSVIKKAEAMDATAGALAAFAERPGLKKQHIELIRDLIDTLRGVTKRGTIHRTAKPPATPPKAVEVNAPQPSIRGIYIALAKVVHPDTELDAERRSEKEELMKQVTRAYQDNDVTKLLKLEVAWVQNENRHVDRLSDETLKEYISALEEQLKDLKEEKLMVSTHPRFAPVAPLLQYPERLALEVLQSEAQRIKEAVAELLRFKTTIESPLPVKDVLTHLRNFIDARH